MYKANCNPILIGSLPVESYELAMELILKHSSSIPLWPQLPRKPREGMVRQFLTGFPGLVDDDDKYYIDTSSNDFETEMASFYEDFFAVEAQLEAIGSSRFQLGHDSASGFFTFLKSIQSSTAKYAALKGQVTGPVTTGIGVMDEKGTPILYDDNLRDILIKLLGLKGLWQAEEMRKINPALQPIIFIDEPGIVSFGSTGFSGVTMEMVSESVAEVIDFIRKNGALAGIHICANGDWGPALSSAADIISFDAYFYFDNFILYKEQLTQFLKRGGILAWGIVPTGDPLVIEKETTSSLYAKWREQLTILSSFGFSEAELMQQTLIAPSCGTGSLTPELAEKVLVMTAEVSDLAKSYLVAVQTQTLTPRDDNVR
jgi:hypothetical protein